MNLLPDSIIGTYPPGWEYYAGAQGGFGGSMDFSGYFATSTAPIGSTPSNIWGAVAALGSQAISAFAPRQLPESPIIPMDPTTGLPVQVGQGIAQVSVKSLPAACGYDPALLSCFTHLSGPYKGQAVKSRRRQRIKLVRDAQGALHPVLCCAPRRMNPLNPRALSRAARRIGSFQRIASNLEKIVQKACRKGLGRGRARMPRMGGYCGPSKRCR